MDNRIPTKYDDIIDSRDIIEAIATLEGDEDNADIVKGLQALESEAEGYSEDWQYGATLIRDSYFTTYAQELAEEIGAIDENASWPSNCIDWEQAADELQMDYTSVDFDGITYWIR